MKKSNALMVFGVGVATLAFALGAQAAGVNVGSMGTTISSQGTGIGGALKTVFVIMGFGAAGFGLWKFIQSSKPGSQETKGGALTWFLVGALLVGLPFMIGSGQQTLTGSDQTSNLGAIGVN